MSHKIAILMIKNYCPGYGDDGNFELVDHITEWEEVSDEEFKLLERAQSKFDFRILEQPTEPKKFIAKTIADWKIIVKEDAAREAKYKKDAAEKALQKKLKKEMKAKETKKQLLARLKVELGEE